MKHLAKPIRRPYFKTYLFSILVLPLCLAQSAEAATVSASAVIDWSTFKITAIDIGNGLPTLTWSNQYDNSQVNYGYYYNANDSAANWSSGTSTTEGLSTSTYSRSASSATSINEINANASLNGAFPYQSLSASSSSQRSGSFTVQGSGLLIFEANYSLMGDLGASSNASANSNASFNLSYYNGGNSGSVNQNVSRYLSTGSAPVTENDILSVALVFKDGWSGSFSANTSASVYGYDYGTGGGGSVPLPGAFWLFGSVLAGAASLRSANTIRGIWPFAEVAS
ncbi:hypothetical protein [Methylomonas fluvii]|uniref:PEP-CTERM sorting domain-containing protein n=1 Tax=Methylomonas fluvii TaxID=1854564 RepID=A0ABR9DA57_9GAMM|nr:hypothetical protein [Methylomonas fluvii]MBD9359651.1 hypothetical protein [Methylomonas fluvii]